MYQIIEKEDAGKINEVRAYFERNKTGNNADEKDGLIIRLKKWGIDLNRFDDVSKCKLLYYLYHFEKNNPLIDGKTIKFSMLLNNPTLENVDNSISGEITRSGELMFKIKNDLFLEVPLETMCICNNVVITIQRRLENAITKLMICLGIPYNVDFLAERISSLPDIDDWINGDFVKSEPSENLFSHVYLKLVQHENLGRENDILDLLPQNLTEDFKNDQHFECMLLDKHIPIGDAKEHLETNREELAKLVFNTIKVSSNDYKKYDKAVDAIENILKILIINTRLLYSRTIPEKLLVVALQCYININKIKKIDNLFYRYNTADKKSLHSEMKQGRDALKKNQLAVTKLIYDTYYIRCDKKDLRDELYKFESYIDRVSKKILSADSVDQMLYMYADIIWDLNGVLYSEFKINCGLSYVNYRLPYGFTIEIDNALRNKFVAITDVGNILDGLIDMMITNLLKYNLSFEEKIYIVDEELDVKYVYNCKCEICFISKRVIVKKLELMRVEKIHFSVEDFHNNI